MSFIPCQDLCTYEGTHCQGCGRSHEEIAKTKKLIKEVAIFAEQYGYDNIDEFGQYFGNKVIKLYKKMVGQ